MPTVWISWMWISKQIKWVTKGECPASPGPVSSGTRAPTPRKRFEMGLALLVFCRAYSPRLGLLVTAAPTRQTMEHILCSCSCQLNGPLPPEEPTYGYLALYLCEHEFYLWQISLHSSTILQLYVAWTQPALHFNLPLRSQKGDGCD